MNYEKGMKFQNRKSGKVGTVTEVDEKYMCVVLMYEDGKDSRVSMNTIKKSFKKLDDDTVVETVEPVVEEKVEEPVVEETVEQTVEEKPKKTRKKQKIREDRKVSVDSFLLIEDSVKRAINAVGGDNTYSIKRASNNKLAQYVYRDEPKDKLMEVFYKPKRGDYVVYMKESTYNSISDTYRQHEYNEKFSMKYFIARRDIKDIEALVICILQADINKKAEETEKTEKTDVA